MDMVKGEMSEKRRSWSRRVEVNGYCKSVKVEELENGFLVEMNEYGDKNGKYQDKCRKFYSENNPLEGLKPDDQEGIEDTIKEFLNN